MTELPPGISSERSGRYIRQAKGYRAFIPTDLPPQPPLQLSGQLQVLLSKADRAVGRLDGCVQILPNPDLFLFMCVRKEAVLSSQIEGTQSSLQDLLRAEANLFVPQSNRSDVGEVMNYIKAMKYGLARLETLPICTRLLGEIHQHLLAGVRGNNSRLTPGEVRRSQNWIGIGSCTLSEATFVPPPPEAVPIALGNLEKFIHGSDDLPALIKIGLVHAQFETIHPFLDGNGRIGRLLISLLLSDNGILKQPVLYLSHYLKRHQQTYYERLQAVHDHGDWEGWLGFFLRGVAEVSIAATITAGKILALREHYREVVTAKLGYAAGNGHKVVKALFMHPIVAVNDLRGWTKTTYVAANRLVSRLVDLGILEEITGHTRNRRFRFAPYIRLFSDEDD